MCSSRQRVAVVLLLAVLLCELSPGAGGRADPGAATFAAAVVPLLGAATQPGPPPAPMPARIPAARQVGAAASLPTKENDGHTPTFAFTVTPKVNPAASYSYDEYVALFGTALQALDLDLVAAFTERLDGDRNGRLVGAEVLALSALLEDEKRAAQQAVRMPAQPPHSLLHSSCALHLTSRST